MVMRPPPDTFAASRGRADADVMNTGLAIVGIGSGLTPGGGSPGPEVAPATAGAPNPVVSPATTLPQVAVVPLGLPTMMSEKADEAAAKKSEEVPAPPPSPMPDPTEPLPIKSPASDAGKRRLPAVDKNQKFCETCTLTGKTDRASASFEANPGLAAEVLSPGQMKAAAHPSLGMAMWGRAVEYLTARSISWLHDPIAAQMFEYRGYKKGPDFVGKGTEFKADITTPSAKAAHEARPNYGGTTDYYLEIQTVTSALLVMLSRVPQKK